jgi:deoxyadenosine/deoxycytidine kinase
MAFRVDIAGLIGAGKTSLADRLATCYDIAVQHEPVSGNPYLADFYDNMPKFSFPLQIYLLSRRIELLEDIEKSAHNTVTDRSIYEDLAFARTLFEMDCMDKRDFDSYIRLANRLMGQISRPHLIIWLDVSPEVAFQRAQERDRKCETKGGKLSLWYLQKLHANYERVYGQLVSNGYVIVRIDWNGTVLENWTRLQQKLFIVLDSVFKPVLPQMTSAFQATATAAAAVVGVD